MLDDYDDFDSKNPVKTKSGKDKSGCPISLSTFCCLPSSDQPQVIEMQSSGSKQTKSNSKTRDIKKNKKAARYRPHLIIIQLDNYTG